MTSQDFQTMRRAMVESQLRTSGVSDVAVVAAMARVPRERFVPGDRATTAYTDRPIPLGRARSLNAPLVVGRLLTEAQVRAGERVLVVGAATGYAAALLVELGATVTAVESDAALAEQARAALAGLDVDVVEGPLAEGAPQGAPYDLILIDGLVEQVPTALAAQLADHGRLACAVLSDGVSRLAIGRRAGADVALRPFADVDAVPLPGFAVARGFVF